MRKPNIVAFHCGASTEQGRTTSRQLFTIHHELLTWEPCIVHQVPSAQKSSSVSFLSLLPTAKQLPESNSMLRSQGISWRILPGSPP